MMRLKTTFFIFCLTLFGFTAVIAQEDPHPSAPTSTDDLPPIQLPPDEELPIDNHQACFASLLITVSCLLIKTNYCYRLYQNTIG